MVIESYQFGRIVIDGAEYQEDVIICPGRVHAGWWRKQGHRLDLHDLEAVLEAGPSVLVIGCGASAMMQVPESTLTALQQAGIKAEVLDTPAAVARFNELQSQGINVAAALHLTC